MDSKFADKQLYYRDSRLKNCVVKISDNTTITEQQLVYSLLQSIESLSKPQIQELCKVS